MRSRVIDMAPLLRHRQYAPAAGVGVRDDCDAEPHGIPLRFAVHFEHECVCSKRLISSIKGLSIFRRR